MKIASEQRKSNGYAPSHHTEHTLSAEALAKRLAPGKARRNGNEWLTCCPAHKDDNPSLSVTHSKDGKLLLCCRAGCSQDDLLVALGHRGIPLAALFPPDHPDHAARPRTQRRTQPAPQKRGSAPNRDAAQGSGPSTLGTIADLELRGFKIVATYAYNNEAGDLLYENVRLEYHDPGGKRAKTFRQRRPNPSGDGYHYTLEDVRRVPYRLPDLVANPTPDVDVTEGEKDADRLTAIGLLATSIAEINKLDEAALEAFKDRVVYIHEDNDPAGRKKACKIAEALDSIAAAVHIVRYDDQPDGSDVSDWLDKGHELEDLLVRRDEAPAFAQSREASERPPEALGDGKRTTTDPLTEMAVAALFEERIKGHRLYNHTRRTWFVERGGIWQKDEAASSMREAQELCQSLQDPRFETLNKAKAVEELTRTAPAIAVTADEFDRDPYLLGTPGGIVDLRSGKLLPADPTARISMSTTVVPDFQAETPLWRKFCSDVQGGDAETVAFLQSWYGYSMTGDTREQKMVFAYGPGRNGKGVMLRAVTDILGTYAHRAAVETFTAGADRHPTELASMCGKRLVYCSETERNRKWAECRIKDVTGGDKLRARFMRQDDFEFQPAFKLYVSGNYEPAIETADQAMRNRFFVVPFDQVYEGEKVDPHLDEKLRAEQPGILAWLIKGCLDWQRRGFIVPRKVQDATNAYFDRQDTFAQWMENETSRDPSYQDTNVRLFGSWAQFAKQCGEDPGTMRSFAERMARAGIKGPVPSRIDGKSVRVYRGLKALML